MGRNLQHREVMKRVAKHGIGPGDAGSAECSRFCRTRRHVHQFTGDDAVHDFDFGGEHTRFGNAERAHAFTHHPFVGGAYGPQFDIGLRSFVTSAATSLKM